MAWLPEVAIALGWMIFCFWEKNEFSLFTPVVSPLSPLLPEILFADVSNLLLMPLYFDISERPLCGKDGPLLLEISWMISRIWVLLSLGYASFYLSWLPALNICRRFLIVSFAPRLGPCLWISGELFLESVLERMRPLIRLRIFLLTSRPLALCL